MILTVTPNPAEDLTWQVASLRIGESHRVPTGASRAGGKGINVARVLAAEGHDVLALTTAGGATGARLRADLEQSGLRAELVGIDGETRRSVAIVDTETNATSVLNEFGPALTETERARLLDRVMHLGRQSTATAISGSLPPGLTPDHLAAAVRELVATGIPIIVDTSGPAMLAAAAAGATVLKPNRDELAAATGEADPHRGARALLDAGARIVVLSLGEDGLLVFSHGDRAGGIRARLPRVLHGNPTGAGDAAVAAIAAALAERPDLDAATDAAADARARLARRATAWSASAVLMPLAGQLSPAHHDLETEVELTTTIDEERS